MLANSTMQFTTPSIFIQNKGLSLVDKNLHSIPLDYKISNDKMPSFFTMSFQFFIQRHFSISIVSLVILLVWIYVQSYLIIHRIREIISEIAKNESHILAFPSKFFLYGSNINEPEGYEFDMIAKLFHGIASITILTHFSILFASPYSQLLKFSSYTYIQSTILSILHRERRVPPGILLSSNSRSYLPKGRYWLDERHNPVYPAVHGGINAFCAYNSNSNLCKNHTNTKPKPAKQLPNVVFLLLDSLSPSYNLLSKNFIQEHVNTSEKDIRKIISNQSYFNPSIFPNFAKYEKIGITFSGVSSLGGSPESGWHSLMTGIYPSQTISNYYEGVLVHSDDFPSFFHSGGYKTLYFSGKPINTDYRKYWVWRRTAEEESEIRYYCNTSKYNSSTDKLYLSHDLHHCTKAEMIALVEKYKDQDFPTWYDKTYRFPEDDVSSIGLSEKELPNSRNPIIPDRLIAYQLISKWNDTKKSSKQPIFASFEGVETTFPFEGFDDEKYYAPFDQSLSKSTPEYIEQKYVQVMKYSDKFQVGSVLDWLSKNDNNTIFVITGKSGARESPIQKPDFPIFDDIVYSSDCATGSSGSDSFFTTSAIIGYLGDDEEVKNILNLNKNAGKTLKIPADHNDLIYTLQDIISQLNNTELPPTHRRSRNLIEILSKSIELNDFDKINSFISSSGWNSFSMTTYLAEFRDGHSLLKTHTAHPKGSHYYQFGSFPNCLRKYENEPMKLGGDIAKTKYDRMLSLIATENYMTFSNRLYNFGFRNKTCIENGYCEFPEPKEIKINDNFYIASICVLPLFLLGFVSFLLNILVVLMPPFNIGTNTPMHKRRQSFYQL
ncbi:hypothetical protein TVAG_495780 [Trichomonas vaginalis G3]|uniref:Uncharacterized protein n=1 Tax=Trichomonas vaginalis (strain ATCC PRA-98 / G3) TaxID=412133 RepID=A2DVL7_TRIV3|nr:arylsulfatase family member family [Trichomonas vaginalis G3]EAY15559.1 hypothetical protein TVAG_495780 [Trichomonas vaginalis G3]KAI5526204.1 arylsulfatase family member family [Trichomonas vaginalis G3]|eukprot:XP_001327782.1 hypothetical protein [Trichomonas vaginalis G3]